MFLKRILKAWVVFCLPWFNELDTKPRDGYCHPPVGDNEQSFIRKRGVFKHALLNPSLQAGDIEAKFISVRALALLAMTAFSLLSFACAKESNKEKHADL